MGSWNFAFNPYWLHYIIDKQWSITAHYCQHAKYPMSGALAA